MSKDKGQKNQKKHAVDRTTENPKVGSSYKSEGKSADKNSVPENTNPKSMGKPGKTA
jgi:hypothetical protein